MFTKSKIAQAVFASLFATLACTPRQFSESEAASKKEEGRVGSFKSGADGFLTNSFWVEGPNGIVVFDTQFLPDITEQLVKEIRKTSNKKIVAAVNLHANPDKFNGNGVFKNLGAELITNEATRKAMESVDAGKRSYWSSVEGYAKRYPQSVPFPEKDGVFKNDKVIDLGGNVRVKLFELKNPGISERQTVATVSIGGTTRVFVGDLVHTKTHAWQENGTPKAWIAALDEVLALAPKGTVYPGRGEPEVFDTKSGAIREQQKYLQVYISAMDATKGMKREERVAKVRETLVREFPAYQMADLINYSLPAEIK